ncbi:MAG: sugar ABC transporter substrate-binding protein [Burkholderiales bacterium]|nr:sugar ABC transporter substrate-binding protein [Burkholderiales bacterium]
MNRRHALGMLAATAALGPRLGAAQSAALKPGKPYAGTSLNVLTVVAPQFSAHEAKLAEFENLTGIKVKYQYVPFASTREKLTAELVAKTDQYDVLSVMDVWGPALYDMFEPLNARLAEKRIDMEARYPHAHLRAARDGNGNGRNILGFPIRGHVQLMFYRKDVFARLGLKPPQTWDEMVEVGRQVQARTDMAGVAMYYGKTGAQNLMIWFNYLWGMGGDLLDAKGQPAFHSPQGVAATQAYVDVLLRHKVAPPGSASFNETDAVNSVAQGKSAMVPVWWWRYAGLTDAKTSTLKPDQVGFAPLPSMPGRAATTYTNTWFYGINRHGKKKDAAMEYLAWLSQPEIERSVLLDRSRNEVVAVQTANLIDGDVNVRFGGMHLFGAQALKGAKGTPLFPQWGQVSDVLEATISEIAAGRTQVKPALEAAAARVRRALR